LMVIGGIPDGSSPIPGGVLKRDRQVDPKSRDRSAQHFQLMGPPSVVRRIVPQRFVQSERAQYPLPRQTARRVEARCASAPERGVIRDPASAMPSAGRRRPGG
jgi:hypothetical protein